MKAYKPIVFIFQAITIGLAIAFMIVIMKPELFDNGRKVVEFIESNGPEVSATAMGSGPVSYADAVEIAAPAVVNINTRKTVVQEGNPLFNDPFFRRFFGEQFGIGPREREETSLGSGVIVNANGYILTNNHVIEGADAIQVTLRDGRTTSAVVVGSDPEADLAVLKIEQQNLPVITLGDADALRVGDVVLAIGNPFGVGQTVTLGIVSATGRSSLGINTFENFIQTDAAINPGNSGGALITARGELVGINTAIFSKSGGSQGIGFAIPTSLAKNSMAQIVEKGYVSRGWMGVEIQELTPQLAESFGLESERGVIIAGVLRDGPADKGGLKPGDIITRINDQTIENGHDALNTIGQTQPGEKVTVLGQREGKELKLKIEVGERPKQEPR